MPLHFERNDITRLHVGAIVNAANNQLLMGGGVCGAIFRAAGARQLQEACDQIGYVATGDAVLTPGFALKAEYVIHTAGPIWQDGHHQEETLLRGCYRSSLRLAAKNHIQSIAFPLISSGIYGYPKDEALRVAVDEIRNWLDQEDDGDTDVYMVLFSRDAFTAGNAQFGEIKSYLDETSSEYERILAEERTPSRRLREEEVLIANAPCIKSEAFGASKRKIHISSFDSAPPVEAAADVSDFAKMKEADFTALLFRYIDRSSLTDPQVYKKANIDRKYFSKIRNGLQPKKNTILALCLALQLNDADTRALLDAAGFSLSKSITTDRVVYWCIQHQEYDVIKVNGYLFDLNEPMLSGVRDA